MKHLGPYEAILSGGSRRISYRGSRLFSQSGDVANLHFTKELTRQRLSEIVENERFYHLNEIDDAIFFATCDYFRSLNARWVNLPLTTRMISSPGEVYSGKVIDYTTDTLPVELDWFDEERKIFLAESAQFYLELRLLIPGVDKVFSIYNSFRKEKADFCHLSEFQHIEFEGKVEFEENNQIALDLMRHILAYLSKYNGENVAHFIGEESAYEMEGLLAPDSIEELSFSEACGLLHKNTEDPRYLERSMQHFGAWEELRLTQVLGKHVLLREYPLMQIPFYHNCLKQDQFGNYIAENADFIPLGGREIFGAGVRIASPDALAQKAIKFNLPLEDYGPYLQTRTFSNYEKSAGFGLGWQRFTHWLLNLPAIWEASHIPRGHLDPKP